MLRYGKSNYNPSNFVDHSLTECCVEKENVASKVNNVDDTTEFCDENVTLSETFFERFSCANFINSLQDACQNSDLVQLSSGKRSLDLNGNTTQHSTETIKLDVPLLEPSKNTDFLPELHDNNILNIRCQLNVEPLTLENNQRFNEPTEHRTQMVHGIITSDYETQGSPAHFVPLSAVGDETSQPDVSPISSSVSHHHVIYSAPSNDSGIKFIKTGFGPRRMRLHD